MENERRASDGEIQHFYRSDRDQPKKAVKELLTVWMVNKGEKATRLKNVVAKKNNCKYKALETENSEGS
jgi:hypothetical protein